MPLMSAMSLFMTKFSEQDKEQNDQRSQHIAAGNTVGRQPARVFQVHSGGLPTGDIEVIHVPIIADV